MSYRSLRYAAAGALASAAAWLSASHPDVSRAGGVRKDVDVHERIEQRSVANSPTDSRKTVRRMPEAIPGAGHTQDLLVLAARQAELETDSSAREASMREVAQQWARHDLVGAIAWAESLGDGGERVSSIVTIALELAQSDANAALQLLDRQPPGEARDDALEGVAAQLAEKDFPAALAWLESKPIGAGRDRILQRLVYVRASRDPGDAARLAMEAFSDSKARADALASIAHRWNENDPVRAAEWAHTLAGSERRRVDEELAIN